MELNRYNSYDRYNSYNKYRYKRYVSDNNIPGCYSCIEYPRRSYGDYKNIENRKLVEINGSKIGAKRDDRGNRVRVIKRVGR